MARERKSKLGIDWNNLEQVRKYRREYNEKYRKANKEKLFLRAREYYRDPVKHERIMLSQKKYMNKPEVKERHNKWMREYRKEYCSRLEVIERMKIKNKERYQKYKGKGYYKEYYGGRIYLDDLVSLLRVKGGIDRSEIVGIWGGRSVIKRGLEIGIISLSDNTLRLTNSPMLAAFDGFFEEACENIKLK